MYVYIYILRIVSFCYITAGSSPQFTATLHNILVLSFPCPHNKHSNVQLQFLSLCRLQQLAMSSRLTVVLVSLLVATPAVISWLWLVIQPERVAIQCPEECRCEKKGYKVNCSGSGLNSIPSILPTDVRQLVLDNNIITYFQNDSFVSKRLGELKIIKAEYCKIRNIGLGAFNGLTKLTRLSLQGNEISEIIPGTFEKISRLEYLDLSYNRLQHLDSDVFSGLVNLKRVTLEGNKLQYLNPDTFASLPDLQILFLSNNSDLQIPTDRHFINSHSLKALGISFCNVRSVSVETFANVSALELLDLRENNPRSVDINILRALPELSTLYLYGNPLQCDCQLQEVWRWCQNHSIQTAYKDTAPECDTPSEVKGIWWGVLEKGQCLQGNISYYGDYKNTSYSYSSIEDTDIDILMDTDIDILMDTDTETEQTGYDSSFLRQYEVQVYAVPFMFGTTGNIIIIIIIICNKDMRIVPNMYILNLAISDLTYLTVHFFEACADKIFNMTLDGGFMCNFLSFCCRLSVGLSAYSVAVLSIYRYRISEQPFLVRVPSKLTWCGTLATICGVWIVAALFAIPSALSQYLCNESVILGFMTYYQRVVIFELLVSCVIPLCVIGFCYIMTACNLVKRSYSMSEETQKPQVKALKNTARVVLGLTVVFIISYLPYHAFMTYIFSTADQSMFGGNIKKIIFYKDYKLQDTLIVSKCLLLINSCLNPVALFCMSSAFRRKFKRYLTRCSKATSPSNDLELTSRN